MPASAASRTALVGLTIATNVALWWSYVALGANADDFGSMRSPGMQRYLLVAASVAYICLLAVVGLLATTDAASTMQVWSAAGCVTVFTLLQLAFLPAVRAHVRGARSKNWARGVLLSATLPITVLAGICLLTRKPLLIGLSIAVVLHVVFNDALLYGFSF